MADGQVLVIDAGSSSIRCHLVDSQSRVAYSASRPWAYLEEPDAPELARAFDHEICWQSAQDAMRECVKALPEGPRSISAIAVTSQRQSLVFLDESGSVIYAGPNTDLRAIFEGFALDSEHGHLISSSTGDRPTFMTAPGKLAWFREHRPDSYTRIEYVLTLADWITFKLTGNLGCERILATESGLIDIESRNPSSPLFRRLDLNCPIPPVHESLSTRGTISMPELGITWLVPVVNAGPDTQCGLVGMGIVEHGSAGIIAGWSATVQMLTSDTGVPPGMKTWLGCFQLPDLQIVESNAGDMGNSLHWLADLLFQQKSDPFSSLNEAAQDIGVGSDGVAAFLGPQVMDTSSLTMKLGGFTFPVPLSLGGPTRGQIARSALESFAYALRANVEQTQRVAGFDADRIALGGGITRNTSFNRIITDVLGREVELSAAHSPTALGASLIARAATDQVSSLPEAAIQLSLENLRLSPDTRDAAEYDDRYWEWLQTQHTLGQMLS